jgi:hypothetical protein
VAKPNSSANVNGQVAGEPPPVPVVNNLYKIFRLLNKSTNMVATDSDQVPSSY